MTYRGQNDEIDIGTWQFTADVSFDMYSEGTLS